MLRYWPWTNEKCGQAAIYLYALHKQVETYLRVHLVAILQTATIVLVAYLCYEWSLLLLFVAVCTLSWIAAFRMVLSRYIEQFVPEPAAVDNEEQLQQVAPMLFPETPMPATPLVRVLETIDLSSSSVEHFIRTTSEQPAPLEQIDPM